MERKGTGGAGQAGATDGTAGGKGTGGAGQAGATDGTAGGKGTGGAGQAGATDGAAGGKGTGGAGQAGATDGAAGGKGTGGAGQAGATDGAAGCAIQYKDESGNMVPVDEKAIVSMNLWGFTPDYFTHSEKMFVDFLRENGANPKAEFFIPLVVNNLVASGTARVKVLTTDSEWFGVTYQGDRPKVIEKLKALIAKGEYPAKLWA
jgi:hypothetical protein